MITIKKSDDGIYETSIKNSVLIIDKKSGYNLKKEIGKIIGNHREVSVNLKQVNAIDKNGYNMLEQLVELARKKNCKLLFNNYGPDITNIIQMLKQTNKNE